MFNDKVNQDGTWKPVPLSVVMRSDAYKQTHWLQTPDGLRYVYSYLESRGYTVPNIKAVVEYLQFKKYTLAEIEEAVKEYESTQIYVSETVQFGIQIILKKLFVGKVLTQEMIDDADEYCKRIFGANYFNRAGWEYILKKYEGRLPLEIRSVPEGMIVPIRNVLMDVVNTDPRVPFLTNFAETMLMENWYPLTVASMEYKNKQIIKKWADISGGTVSPFHMNDFGFRGVSSLESAGIGGCAHLVVFDGTDTLEGIRYADYYYGGDGVTAASAVATEHSTTTVYTRKLELDAYRTFIERFPKGILSVVSDSYNIYDACKMFGTTLKEEILARDGKFVVRPDSGNPITVSVEVLDILWNYFGGSVNAKGFKVLNPQIGVIYGDGINTNSLDKILENVVANGYCADCIVFGMGGGMLQQVDRDTFKFAFKCSAAEVNGNWVDVYKDPITDSGKGSKRGRLMLIRNLGKIITTSQMPSNDNNLLVPTFRNGELLVDYTFADVKKNLEMSEEIKKYENVCSR